jgi:thiosulfate/3-mercaptopyruvate sulfurtransferase
MHEYTTLIDAVALNTALNAAPTSTSNSAPVARPDSRCIVLDCRFDLARPAWGEAEYAATHVPGAHYAHLDRDLASPITPRSGRHPLPAPEDFARRATQWGIDSRSQVVAYDQGNGMYAARAWWLFRWLGHRRVAVLDGGFAAWTAAGLPVAGAAPPSAPIDTAAGARPAFVARPDDSMLASATDLQRDLPRGRIGVVDARAADPVAGHVPGAVNHPFARNLDARGRFLDAEALRSAWRQTFDERPAAEWVAMCGSGVSACHNLLALEHAGLAGARLYAGSWSEWIRDPSRGVER